MTVSLDHPVAVDGEVAEEGRRKWRQGDYQLPGQAVVGEVGGDQEEGDDGDDLADRRRPP